MNELSCVSVADFNTNITKLQDFNLNNVIINQERNYSSNNKLIALNGIKLNEVNSFAE